MRTCTTLGDPNSFMTCYKLRSEKNLLSKTGGQNRFVTISSLGCDSLSVCHQVLTPI